MGKIFLGSKIGYHSRFFGRECNKERGFKNQLYLELGCQGKKKEALGRIANVVVYTNWQSRNVQFQQAFIAEYTYIIE